MKKFFIFIFILTVFLPISSHSNKWEKIGKFDIQEMNINIYADNTTLVQDAVKKDHKKLWVRLELPKDLESTINEEPYRVRKEQYYFDCKEKKFTVSHLILINNEEKIIYNSGSFDPFTDDYTDSWSSVLPDSGPEVIYNYSCKNEKSLTEIEIAEEIEKEEINNKDISINKDIAVTGGETTDGLDVKKVRWAKHKNYERLVFDIYKWGGYDKPEGIEPAIKPGHFRISKNSEDNILNLKLSGYRAFSASFPDIEESSFIKNITMNKNEEIADDSSFFLLIELKKAVEFKVLELESPARIALDLKEKN